MTGRLACAAVFAAAIAAQAAPSVSWCDFRNDGTVSVSLRTGVPVFVTEGTRSDTGRQPERGI